MSYVTKLSLACLKPAVLTLTSHTKLQTKNSTRVQGVKAKGSLYSITERIRVPELIAVLGSQPVGDVSHKPGGRLPLLSTRGKGKFSAATVTFRLRFVHDLCCIISAKCISIVVYLEFIVDKEGTEQQFSKT